MVLKSFRLSYGFWHRFFPNSSKLVSPQSILFEIWDIEKRVRENKWNPGITGVENVTFSNIGDKFVITGGWHTSSPNKSTLRIYDADTLNCIDEFSLMEPCSNPKFTCDDKNLIFGTREGKIYDYCLEEKTLTAIYSLEGHMINLIHHGKHNNRLYVSATKVANEQNNWAEDFILEYNIEEHRGRKINFADENSIYKLLGQPGGRLSGLSLFGENLAILTTRYYDKVASEAKTHIYNTASGKLALVKENFKVSSDPFDENSCIVWNNSGNKLAFIGVEEVYVVDIESNSETAIQFENATSVEFSNCGMGLAVGGEKAKLFKIE